MHFLSPALHAFALHRKVVLSQSALLAQAIPEAIHPVRSVLQTSGWASLQRFCPAGVQVGAVQVGFELSHSAAEAQVAS